MKNPPTHIVLHHNGVPGRTVDDIRRTHKAKGWTDTGYHWVIRDDASATVQRGRQTYRPNGAFNPGAHVSGLNRTIGICLIGNGNERPFSDAQMAQLRHLVSTLQLEFGIPVDRVIGHRETVALVPRELATKKTCPGKHFDLPACRASLLATVAVA
jgi:N-acetyl-anhydromuramyl-L-alanine amidase AmpD